MNGDALQAIRDRTRESLRGLLPPGPNAAVLDFPSHMNAGDSLIYLGQQRYLNDLGYSVKYLADWTDFDEALLRRHLPEGPVLLQGGGNLGDRWIHTQAFREHVISRLHDRPIVQLPQSVEFRDPANLERARKVFGDHPDLLLLMRDHVGLETARAAFPDTRVEFCPDLALGAAETGPPRPAPHQIVTLLRQDSEGIAVHDDLVFPPRMTVSSADWHLSGVRLAAWRGIEKARRLTRQPVLRHPGYPLNRATAEAMARLNVSSARRILAMGDLVVTDRLHAAVLATLMGKPVVVMDNAYGKIRPIFEDYLSSLGRIEFATTAAEATQKALNYFRAMD